MISPFAGGFATRRVDHAFDLSSRLLFPLDPAYTSFVPVSVATLMSLPGIPDPVLHYPTWPNSNGFVQPIGTIPRIDNYEKMPQDGSHLRAKLSGVSEYDMEWAISAYAELYDTTLGHIGHSWVRDEYDLDFRANQPIGEKHHLSFGASYRNMSFDVVEAVTSPWKFPTFDPDSGTFRSDIPILDYGNSPTKFERCYRFSSGLH